MRVEDHCGQGFKKCGMVATSEVGALKGFWHLVLVGVGTSRLVDFFGKSC